MTKSGLIFLIGFLFFVLAGCSKKDDFPFPDGHAVLKGNLLDCSNNPIAKGHIEISYTDIRDRLIVEDVLTNSKGEFEFIKDSLSQKNVRLRAFDLDGSVISNDFFVDLKPNSISRLPDIEVCKEVKEKFREETVIIKNQSELDFFGSLGYTKIDCIWISGVDNVLALKNLKEVTDCLRFGEFRFGQGQPTINLDNEELKTLNGLENLERVGGTFAIYNSGLTNLTGLNNLVSVGSLRILKNEELLNLEGAPSLESAHTISVGEIYTVREFRDDPYYYFAVLLGNAKLNSIAALKNIETFSGNLSVQNNPMLTNLDGLQNFLELKNLTINENENLNDISALSNLTKVNGSLIVGNFNNSSNQYGYGGNDALVNLSGLENLTHIEDRLVIGLNDELENLNALMNLTSVRRLNIYGNNKLTHLDAFSNIATLEDLTIGEPTVSGSVGNRILANFCGLRNVEVTGSYFVRKNAYNPTQEQLKTDACKAN